MEEQASQSIDNKYTRELDKFESQIEKGAEDFKTEIGLYKPANEIEIDTFGSLNPELHK